MRGDKPGTWAQLQGDLHVLKLTSLAPSVEVRLVAEDDRPPRGAPWGWWFFDGDELREGGFCASFEEAKAKAERTMVVWLLETAHAMAKGIVHG